VRYLWSQAQALLQTYDGRLPLTHVLRAHFKKHPALGSRDRKLLSALVYAWYRCGKGLSGTSDHQLLLQAALFLTHTEGATRRLLPPEWQEHTQATLEEKESLLQGAGISFDIEKLLPAGIEFSKGIDRQSWLRSLLRQPALFLRIRHSHRLIEDILNGHGIAFHWLEENCLSLPNGTDADKLLPAGSFVVQDASSQKTGHFFQPEQGESWWDACCGAGGKTLLLADSGRQLQLTASDIRPTILNNLAQRFKAFGLPLPQCRVIDAASESSINRALGNATFDGMLCDAPCSGSGTWARTPEQLYFFEPAALAAYTQRQLTILHHLPARLKKGGRLLYATCSVFAAENENLVAALLEMHPLRITESRLINGIDQAADSLYVAVLEA